MYSIDDLVTSVLSKKFTLLQWNPVTTTTKTTILILILLLLIIIIIMVYLTHPRGGFPVKIHYLQLKINKNALFCFFLFLFLFVFFIILRLLTKHILQLQNLKLKGST